MQEIVSAMSRVLAAQDATERFDKDSLVRQHEIATRRYAHLREETASGNIVTSSLSVAGPSPAATLASLQRLRPIRLAELNVDFTHRGRVLFGTLCVNPFNIVGTMTVLEDDQGLAVRVAIYNLSSSDSTPAALIARYPNGAKVAIKEPYFKRSIDGGLAIRVENPANLVKLTEEEASQHHDPLFSELNLEEERGKGNECFRKKDWRGAITHYTTCICASNDGDAARKTRLLAYSNRAETHLQTGEFERALLDSNQCLQIEPGHLKALFRKGRALHGLKDYAQACQVLKRALQISPGQEEIDAALRNSIAACARNRQGEYDISNFLLGTQPPGQFGDFVGDVEIKRTRDGRGRGLYATNNIGTGELFLVSNAVAIDDQGFRPFKLHRRPRNEASSEQKTLIAAVIGAAEKSQKLLQQLYALDDGSEQVHASTLAMDLFDTNSRCEEIREIQIDEHRIRQIVSRNSLAGEAEKSGAIEGFSGMWVLPSFINHSCIPNATRLNVGRAMFLHAAKPIGKGEEITMSYFDALLPQPHREAMSQAWGFKCNCKRCFLEKSLKAAVLKSLNEQFEALHNNALEETNAARSAGEEFPADLPKSAEFAQVYEKMEKTLCKCQRMKAEEMKWVRASYVTAFWAGTQSIEFFDKTLEDTSIPCGDEIREAVVDTVPGDLRTLAMAAHQAEGLKHWIGGGDAPASYSPTFKIFHVLMETFGEILHLRLFICTDVSASLLHLFNGDFSHTDSHQWSSTGCPQGGGDAPASVMMAGPQNTVQRRLEMHVCKRWVNTGNLFLKRSYTTMQSL